MSALAWPWKSDILEGRRYTVTLFCLGLALAIDFLPLCRSFFALRAKNDLLKEESTMLPQAISAFA